MKTHGQTSNYSVTTEYNTWGKMKSRCYSDKEKSYKNYGGRGIKVCDRWLNSFENFFEDMGKKPTPKHSLDRFPDNNGNYEPENCRWAVQKVQCRNKRNNVLITYLGETKPLKQWTEDLGIKYKETHGRIKKYGWSIEKAFTTPIVSIKRLVTFNNKTQTINKWAKETGMRSGKILFRLNKGWDLKDVFNPNTRIKTA